MSFKGLVTFVTPNRTFSLYSDDNAHPDDLGVEVIKVTKKLLDEEVVGQFVKNAARNLFLLPSRPLEGSLNLEDCFQQLVSGKKVSLFDETSFEEEWGCDYQYEINLVLNKVFFRKCSKTIFAAPLKLFAESEVATSEDDPNGYFWFN